MKKLYIFIIISFIACIASAATVSNDDPNDQVKSAEYKGSVNGDGFGGTLRNVSSSSEISLYLDFSSCSFDRRREEAFVNYMMTTWDMDLRNEYFDLSWNYYKSIAAADFLNNINASLEDQNIKTRIVRKQGSTLTLKIIFRDINDKGETKADYLIVNTKTGEVEAAFLKIYNGDKGNYLEQLQKGLHNAAEEFSKEFAKYVKSGR